MDIKNIDKNFDTTFTPPEDIEWLSVLQVPFSLHGVFYAEEEGVYRRMPKAVADSVSEGVAFLSKHTAGGRIRFSTNSPYLAVRVEEPFEDPFPHMTIVGKCGISMFVDGEFVGTVMPWYRQIIDADPSCGGSGTIVFDGIKYPYGVTETPYEAQIFMPLYSGVKAVYIGVKKGSLLQAPKGYTYSKPVLFYGSSITQGGCASKAGDDYVARLCRTLDTEIINLGFSGNAKGEREMAEYLADLHPSVFVMDYDHNAPSVEHLANTHFSLYETFRKKNPTTPIIMMTMPKVEEYDDRPVNKARKEEILKTFARAKELGDENVYYIDCYGCFGEKVDGECGTVDETHPDSLGFLRMAERVYPVLKKLLNENLKNDE